MTRCTICGKKVPKKRLEPSASPYSSFFCSQKCQIVYSDQMLKMMRDTELEVEDELKLETGVAGDSWAAEALDALDQAAATATAPGQRMSPEEVAARFIGSFAGKFGVKFATRAYTKFAESVRGWVDERARRKTAEAAEATKKPNEPPPTKAPDEKKPESTADRMASRKAPEQTEWKRVKEPEDLDELSLEEQRMWYLRRFFLPQSATIDEVRTKFKTLAKKYHPDNKATGNGKVMAIINKSKTRLEQIEFELSKAKTKRKAKAAR